MSNLLVISHISHFHFVIGSSVRVISCDFVDPSYCARKLLIHEITRDNTKRRHQMKNENQKENGPRGDHSDRNLPELAER